MAQSGIPTKWIKWIVGAFVLALVLLGIEVFRSSEMASNERYAVKALRDLSIAAVDFYSNDRDGNGINDTWTGDVAGLRYLEVNGKPIALIPAEFADADAEPLEPRLGGPKPYRGYLFLVLRTVVFDMDRQVTLQAETDSRGRKVYGTKYFGFCAYPAKVGATGRHSFYTAGGSVYREHAKAIPGRVKVFYESHDCRFMRLVSCPPENCPEKQKETEMRNKLKAQFEGP